MRKKRVLRIVAVIGLLSTVVLLVLLQSTEWLVSLGGRVRGARLDRAKRSPNHSDGKFRNEEPSRMMSGSTSDMLQRQFFGDEQREPLGPVPVERRTNADYAQRPASGLRATWIGWSSVLVEIDGAVVMTDPVWSERCSPSTLVGPKRFHAPPIALADLPHVDAVVISHDHYDHLDMPTVRFLASRGTPFVVPLGIGAHLERWRVPAAQIHELDWRETTRIGKLQITSTPARHYSGRNPMYMDEALWGSWVIAGPDHRVFFSGDTGYSRAFRAIGEQHGPFDLTLIKVGASDPSWSEIHMTPEEAVQTHLDVRGRVMLPVHWATFNLAYHPWREPADRALAAANSKRATIVIPRPGELVDPATPRAPAPWWHAAAAGR
jgi:L-ascorbate metabolism protein UlaG (beta-lactamase superfamily)